MGSDIGVGKLARRIILRAFGGDANPHFLKVQITFAFI